MFYKNLKFFYTSFSDFTQGAPHINKNGSSAGILLVLVLFEEQQRKKMHSIQQRCSLMTHGEEHSRRT
jgi:hypothetical protein